MISRMPTSLAWALLICAGLPEPQNGKLGLRQFLLAQTANNTAHKFCTSPFQLKSHKKFHKVLVLCGIYVSLVLKNMFLKIFIMRLKHIYNFLRSGCLFRYRGIFSGLSNETVGTALYTFFHYSYSRILTLVIGIPAQSPNTILFYSIFSFYHRNIYPISFYQPYNNYESQNNIFHFHSWSICQRGTFKYCDNEIHAN